MARRRVAREVFRQLDVNHDSAVSKEELVAGLEELGEGDLGAELFDILDANQDGKITKLEFVNSFAAWQNMVLQGRKRRSARANLNTLYKRETDLGHGTTGDTYKVYHLLEGRLYACKSVVKSSFRTRKILDAFRVEIKVHAGLDHPHIVKLKEVLEDRDECHMIMELCAGGPLLDAVSQQGNFSERDAARLLRQLLSALKYLHAKGIVHRTIAPENLLLTSKDLSKADLKVIDFGTAVRIMPNKRLTEVVGAPGFIAPEVLLGEYAHKADLFSCGTVLYQLLTGTTPFSNETLLDQFHQILHEEVNMAVFPVCLLSPESRALMEAMFTKDPDRRPTAEQLLQFNWVMLEGNAAPSEPLDEAVVSGIRSFARMNNLKKQAYKVIAKQLNTSELLYLETVFHSIDRNRSGTISLFELRDALGGLGHEKTLDKEITALMNDMDIDGNGMIEYAEFLAATVKMNLIITERNLRSAFKHFDKDKSGYITREELREVLQKTNRHVTDEEILQIVLDVDVNSDGRIEYEEFVAFMTGANVESIARMENAAKTIAGRVSEEKEAVMKAKRESKDVAAAAPAPTPHEPAYLHTTEAIEASLAPVADVQSEIEST